MVLGIRSKSRKNVAIRVEYLIHIQEIKPWPLSQSQKSAQSIVFLQWENGDRPSGSVTSEVGDGRIEFAESFRLPITLIREASRKGAAHDSYQKNILEFFLYEPRKDKPTKGQLLGTAVINLADYGIVKETIAITAPMNCKKISKNSGQPVLHINIQPSGNEGNDSVSEATGEGNDEEGEIAAFTDDDVDDDVSSHSSLTTTSSTQYSAKTEPETSKDNVEGIFREPSLAFRTEPASTGSSPPAKLSNHLRISLPPLPSIGHSNPRNSANDSAVSSYVPQEKSMPILKKSVTHGVRYSSSSLGYQDNPQNWGNKRLVDNSWKMPEYVQESTRDNIVANPTNNAASSSKYIRKGMNGDHIDSKVTQEDERKYWSETKNGQDEARVSDSLFSPSRDNGNKDQQENGKKDNLVKLKENSFDVKQASRTSLDSSTDYSCTYSNDDIGVPCGIIKNNSKLKHLKSVQLHSDTAKKDRLLDNTEVENPKRTEVSKATHDGGIAKAIGVGKGKTNSSSDSKGELESQIEMLKEELREAAAVEVGLYSVVAEHGSSANKMHAPARRLSRFFFHACKAGSKTKKENAARTAISGFILVSKACGNDVPRLTFWLSNSIMLRASIGQITRKQQCSDGLSVNNNGNGKFSVKGFDNWDDPKTFMIALEKFESWIFSRIVESVWWQTMTPHMQPAAAKTSSSRKASGRKNGIADHERNNFSVELWKKAFKDACQRLCPARAGGHECGCLPVLARLVMEQLVDRLDVAMFNAILRENGEEMPTDPVSDPISDSKVLPIPAGRSSFGAGAQLKNAIGSWSRCLTDIFDIDDGHDDRSELNEKEKPESPTPFKAFRLLNALSDLMMIPFEMLADKSTREEVCPSLSATLIKMILYTFVPDEFCPNPIPETVFEALDSEDDSEVNAESVTSFPCTANPTVYSPPSATSLAGVLGDTGSQALQRSGSSVLRKSYTSDDELDELDLPISSIIKDNLQGKKKGDRKVVRYQLLREVWKDSE